MSEKIGKILSDYRQQNHEVEDDVIEYRRMMEPKIRQEMHQKALIKSKENIYAGKDFYIVLKTFQDRMLMEAKYMIFTRLSCPTPVFKDSVFKYHHLSNTIEFLFCLPSELMYNYILKNQIKFLGDKETKQLAQFCILDSTGELLKWVIKENGNKPDALIKINNEKSTVSTAPLSV